MSETEEPHPPLLEHPRNPDVRLIETAADLKDAAEVLVSLNGPVALDAERASGFRYFNNAYLVQVFREGGPIYLIDPQSCRQDAENAFESFAAVVNELEWVLHAATQDLACLSELGLRPKRIFDTELGARLLGLQRVGLGATCELLLGFRLAKEHSAVDWSTRPLKKEWLNYAALDVDVLLDLRKAMQEQLDSVGKADLAYQEFEHLLTFKPKPVDPKKWRSMSGLHTVKNERALAIAKELWEAREALAQKIDVSPSRLIPDASIVSVCAQHFSNRAALAASKDFTGRASRSYLDTWWDAIQRGTKTSQLPNLKPDPAPIPNHRFWSNRFPEADSRLKAAKATLSEIASDLNLPIENLLTPETLRAICWNTEIKDIEGIKVKLLEYKAREWQINAVSGPLSLCLTNLPILQTEE